MGFFVSWENCLNNVCFALMGYAPRFERVCPVYLRRERFNGFDDCSRGKLPYGWVAYVV